ncbi:nucleotide sugar dehydrogenase [bacterium]|nr:nucleotide sugar dehydrogenase [candidate division CSSED10-310 bacterium]
MLEKLLSIKDYLDKKQCICVVGLGYVGLPLATILNRKYDVVGFDVKQSRIEALRRGEDVTGEVDAGTLKNSTIRFSWDPAIISESRVVIITVPTPVNAFKIPDLSPVLSATRTVGRNMSKDSVIVYESTVYPGVTEDECVPILEAESGLTHLKDFHVGYSPERVNPGDKQHTVDLIRKVVSGDTPDVCSFLSDLYGEVITAGVHRAPTIRTAEAAKVIENTQRDLNIALMNELALIFNRMGIDTNDVLDAAATKWNFLRFEPGLVGGHCIGVDPYYLTFKAESLGYRPEVILAGRRINDSMGKFIAEKTVKLLIRGGRAVQGSRILILGLTFKENISDIRNTRVIDIVKELGEYDTNVSVWDPHADRDDVRMEYGLDLIADPESNGHYDGVILAVKHREIVDNFKLERLLSLCRSDSPVLIDVKGIFNGEEAKAAGFAYWRL